MQTELSLTEELEPYIRCPNCRNIKLLQVEEEKWKCTACGFWTISPPTQSIQESKHERAGTETPLTSEQKTEIKRGRDYWKKLVQLDKKQALSLLITYAALAYTFNLAIMIALEASLTVSWAITAWVATGFVTIIGILLFFSSSMKRRAAFLTIFIFFLVTSRYWYELTLRTLAIT